jgi:hypothetical protein
VSIFFDKLIDGSTPLNKITLRTNIEDVSAQRRWIVFKDYLNQHAAQILKPVLLSDSSHIVTSFDSYIF